MLDGLSESYVEWADGIDGPMSAPSTLVDAAVGLTVLSRGSGSVTEWLRQDVDALARALCSLPDRLMALSVVGAVYLLGSFLGATGRWTGSRADLVHALQAFDHVLEHLEEVGSG